MIFSVFFLVSSFSLHAEAVSTAAAPIAATVSVETLLNEAQKTYNERANPQKGKESIAIWEEALKAAPANYEALWKSARAYYWLGNHSPEKERLEIYTKGKNYAQAAVLANPEGVDGHYWLGVCLGRYGETKGIFKSLALVKPIRNEMETVLKLDPHHAGAHHVLGAVYRKAPGRPLSIGNKKKALAYAKKAVELDPASLKYLTGLAEAELAAGDKENAKKHLEEVLRMPPNSEYSPESLEEKETAQKLLKGY